MMCVEESEEICAKNSSKLDAPQINKKRKRCDDEDDIKKANNNANENFEESVSESKRKVTSGQNVKKFLDLSSINVKILNINELKALYIQQSMISDEDGDRLIHIAIVKEDIKLVQNLCSLMLVSGISLDITNYLRQTPLHLAVMIGNAKIVQMLLEHGASFNLKDRNGNTVIQLAVKNFKENVLQLILSHCKSKEILDCLDWEGYCALHYAVMSNNNLAVRILSNNGANLDVIDGKSGRTPLMHAVLMRNAKMVHLLIKHGANLEKLDYSGRSAFDLALQIANSSIIKFLEKEIATKCLPVSSKKSIPDNISFNMNEIEKAKTYSNGCESKDIPTYSYKLRSRKMHKDS